MQKDDSPRLYLMDNLARPVDDDDDDDNGNDDDDYWANDVDDDDDVDVDVVVAVDSVSRYNCGCLSFSLFFCVSLLFTLSASMPSTAGIDFVWVQELS